MQAARAASSAAAAAQMPVHVQEQPPDLPAFGSGIEFRPRKKPRQQPKAEAPAAASTHIVSGPAQDDEDVMDAEQVRLCLFCVVSCTHLPVLCYWK